MFEKLGKFSAVAALSAAALTAGATAPLAQAAKPSASVTMFGADTAFILPHGSIFMGATATDPRGGVSGAGTDGDLSFGAGFGNPIDAVGLEVDVNVTSLSDDFGDSGSLTLKVARALLLQPNHVIFGSVAASNLGAWGDDKASDERWNVAVSGLTQIEGPALVHPVMWTVGYGSDSVLSTPGSSLTEDGLFAGVGIGVTRHLGVAISGTENQLNAGIGVTVPGVDGLSVSYGVNDITDNMNRKQQMLSVSYTLTDVFGGR
ncbi:hypothetical protein [Pseudooceanicola aestuarii]|uniref:hypothetical protein n=1 Tax=Pseudooceanicola aestuarii TaxID=2697319 RepID=UPI0013D03E3A|nr:hypothetical protein [Pseudooceanicola aestuarii]